MCYRLSQTGRHSARARGKELALKLRLEFRLTWDKMRCLARRVSCSNKLETLLQRRTMPLDVATPQPPSASPEQQITRTDTPPCMLCQLTPWHAPLLPPEPHVFVRHCRVWRLLWPVAKLRTTIIRCIQVQKRNRVHLPLLCMRCYLWASASTSRCLRRRCGDLFGQEDG